MTRTVIYICLLLLPLCSHAWQDIDIDTTTVGDSIIADDYNSADYDDDSYQEEHTATAPPPAPVYLKKSFDNDFKKHYTDDDFNYKEEEPGDNWAQKFFAWVRSVLDSIFGGSGESHSGSSSGPHFPIFETLSVLLILVVVYFIARAILQKDGYWIFGRSSKRIFTEDLTVENLHEMDFATLISQTKAQQDYRLALRYYYLWLLKKMAARNVIDWNWEKTNSDYYYEIKDNALRDDFKYLSYVYDYSWYGEFPVDEKSFGKAEAAFKKALNTI